MKSITTHMNRDSTHCRNCIRNVLKELFGTDCEDIDKYVVNLEKGIYNASIREAKSRRIVRKWDNNFFVTLYADKLRSVFMNLKNDENQLIERIKSGELLPHKVAFMNHQELKPDMWRKYVDEKIARDKMKYDNDMREASDEFKCGRCKQRKCDYYQLQTRSADEPMTTFVTCLNCGNHWKC